MVPKGGRKGRREGKKEKKEDPKKHLSGLTSSHSIKATYFGS